MVLIIFVQHSEFNTVSRVREGGYREAASKALPRAVQGADYLQLFENGSAEF